MQFVQVACGLASLPLLPSLVAAPVLTTALLSSLLWAAVFGLYDHTDEVFDLRDDNFESMVLKSDFVWVVEFYAPW